MCLVIKDEEEDRDIELRELLSIKIRDLAVVDLRRYQHWEQLTLQVQIWIKRGHKVVSHLPALPIQILAHLLLIFLDDCNVRIEMIKLDIHEWVLLLAEEPGKTSIIKELLLKLVIHAHRIVVVLVLLVVLHLFLLLKITKGDVLLRTYPLPLRILLANLWKCRRVLIVVVI